MATTADVSFVAFSCLHAPLQDEEAFDSIIETISKEKPDVVVHLGDGHEMSWASKFDDAGELTAVQEYDVHNGLLAQIRKAHPSARRVMLPGNHEWRLYSPRIEPCVREALHWTRHEPELEHWEQPVDYLHCRHRGWGRWCSATGSPRQHQASERKRPRCAVSLGCMSMATHTGRPSTGLSSA